jgi:multiple sugar transport system permease protein
VVGSNEVGSAGALPPAPARLLAEGTAPSSVGVSGSRPAGARNPWPRRIAYAILIGYALLMFIPFIWSLVTSFKTLPDSVRLTFIPDPFTLAAYDNVFNRLDPSLPRLFFNSGLIAVVVTVSNVVLGSIAGYAFARLRFPGREAIFLLVLATLMIPDQLRLVPVYLILNAIGLTKGVLQYGGVMLVLAISATSIFLLRQYFLSIPREIEEAARMDGAGYFTTFWRVMLPLAGPALAAVAILQFQGTWNGFFWPFVLIQQPDQYTVPVALTQFRLQGGLATDWPPLMALVVLATIPVLALYLFFQRYFVEGIAASGVKG